MSDLEATHTQKLVFWDTVMVLASLSALGSAFIIVCSIALKRSRNFNTRLICYLSFADFMISVICLALCGFNLMNGHLSSQSSPACYIQPILTWYFMFASVIWIGVIAYSNYHILCLRKPFTPLQEIIANVLAWGLPLAAALIPTAKSTNFYGHRSGLWCSYDSASHVPQIIVLTIFVVPTLAIVVFSYTKIFMKIRTMGRSDVTGSIHHAEIQAVKKLGMYTASYLLVWLPMFIAYIAEAVLQMTIPFWAEFFTLQLVHMQGIFNFVLYGFNVDMKNALGELLNIRCMMKDTYSGSISPEPSRKHINVLKVLNEPTNHV